MNRRESAAFRFSREPVIDKCLVSETPTSFPERSGYKCFQSFRYKIAIALYHVLLGDRARFRKGKRALSRRLLLSSCDRFQCKTTIQENQKGT